MPGSPHIITITIKDIATKQRSILPRHHEVFGLSIRHIHLHVPLHVRRTLCRHCSCSCNSQPSPRGGRWNGSYPRYVIQRFRSLQTFYSVEVVDTYCNCYIAIRIYKRQFCDPSQECLDDISCGPGCICLIETNEGFCGNAT